MRMLNRVVIKLQLTARLGEVRAIVFRKLERQIIKELKNEDMHLSSSRNASLEL